MGLLDYLNRAVDKVVTTVTEFVTPQSTSEVSKTQKPKETVPMVSQKTQEAQKNEDKVEIKTKTADSVYKKIEQMCVDYKMSMEDVKKAKLLEGILGCSTEELTKKSDEEINKAIEALQFTLSWQSWVLPFQSRDIDDIKEITVNANKKYIALKTGRGCWSDSLRWSKSLEDKLKDAGYNEVTKENVESYFESLISGAIASKDPEKISEAYTEALKTFGDLLNDTTDPAHKEILTSAISKLQASVRATAAELSLTSCGNNTSAKSCVARGIAKNYRAMACTADAFGERTDATSNIKISQMAFQNMSEEDSLAALAETKDFNKALEAKIQNGENLTEEEQYYCNNVRTNYYAGAMVGASCNTNYSSPDNVLNTIDTDTADLGIREQVYATASNYVNSNQDTLPITAQQFTQKVNKATNGNYTSVLENGEQTIGTNSAKSKINNEDSKKDTTKPQTATSTDKTTAAENNTQQTVSVTTAPTYGTERAAAPADTTIVKQTRANAHIATPQEKGETAQTAQPTTPTQEFATRQKAIQQGVKAVKEYAKENNVNTMELAIESLNSSNASCSTKKWALAQFEAASKSEQILNFHKISNGSSAIAAAKTMDDQTRSQLSTFRSYYIKEAVENLNENSVA